MGTATKKQANDGLREELLNDESVLDMICRRAYQIFEARGREHGHDREDWLQAEGEILELMISKELLIRAELAPAGFPDPEAHQELSGYTPSAAQLKQRPVAEPEQLLSAATPARALSDYPWPADETPAPPAYTKFSRKELKKESSSVGKEKKKGKKLAGPSDDGATETGPENKAKKSGHKLKAIGKGEKKAERRQKEKHSGKP
jgi:hypothetical protein